MILLNYSVFLFQIAMAGFQLFFTPTKPVPKVHDDHIEKDQKALLKEIPHRLD